jgi:hypothetical protein
MIVDEVDVVDAIRFEAEDELHVAADVGGEPPGQLALQAVQAITGKVHVCRRRRSIKTGEHSAELVGAVRRNATGIIIFVKAAKTLMAERLDHRDM